MTTASRFFYVFIAFMCVSNQSHAMMRFTRYMPYLGRSVAAAAQSTHDASNTSELEKKDTIDVFGPGLRDGEWKRVPRSHWEKGIDNAAYLTAAELRWYLRAGKRAVLASEIKRIGFRIVQPIAAAALIASPMALSFVCDPQEVLPELAALTVAAGAAFILMDMSTAQIRVAHLQQSAHRCAYVKLVEQALAAQPKTEGQA